MAVKVQTERRSASALVPLAEEARALELEVVEEKTSPARRVPKTRIASERGGVAIWDKTLFHDPPVPLLRLRVPTAPFAAVPKTTVSMVAWIGARTFSASTPSRLRTLV